MPLLQVAGRKVYYESHGPSSGTPLVLVMGMGGSCKGWLPLQVPEFSQQYRTLIFDNRGSAKRINVRDNEILDNNRPNSARALRALVERHRFDDGGPLRMRIGIDSGPVIVGVIGKRKFAYDMWGDTVNTAARMESHGLPGEIQISSATRRLLGNRYEFEERGVIEVKGKGGMTTFLLRGRRSSCPSPEGDLDGRRGECG